jgi:vacuolar protein sorting-associated protein 51
MNENEQRSKRKALLQNYYNVEQKNDDPMNINSSSFDPETFLSKQIKEKSLGELMDLENEVVKEVRCLDSEMQTLVYENYNKFISATDTIRKVG